MTTEYRIEAIGEKFIVIDPWSEIVGRYPPDDEAYQNLERCIKKDAMWDSAKILVDNAIKTHMQLNGVDRNTACYWVFGAAEASE